MEMDGGFFIVDRGVFQHHLFVGEPYSRREAWLWMIGMAAWQPTGRRTRGGIVNLERGELVVTERDLTGIWQWSKSTVRRFLLTLQAEKMIAARVSGPCSGPRTGPNPKHQITLLTICNYESFQTPKRIRPQRADHVADHEPDHGRLQALAQQQLFDPKQLNQLNHSVLREAGKGVGKGASRAKPRHGSQGRGMIWFDHGSDEWRVCAQDYRDVRGVELMPIPREGGAGNWFVIAGEAARSRKQSA